MAMSLVTEDLKKRAISWSDGVEKRQKVKQLIITLISQISKVTIVKKVKHIVRHIRLRSAIKRVSLELAFLLQTTEHGNLDLFSDDYLKHS